jgi:L-2,4-diaminobutyric acid acetyltransferase
VSAAAKAIDLRFRNPEAADGAAIWRFVEQAGVLEQNSAYSYMLLCQHFGDTSIVAEQDGTLAGFVTAYRPPRQPDTVFVWQVGVARAMRGRGLGVRLLDEVIAQPACCDVRFLEASVTTDNDASKALFQALARKLSAPCSVQPFFDKTIFPEPHATEELFRIGPFKRSGTTPN